MKDNRTISEISVSAILAALVAVVVFAHTAWMPSMLTMTILTLLVAAFSAFAVFVWRESNADEREQLIQHVASRSAYLATGAVLLIGIVAETLMYESAGPWLGFALLVMIAAKIIGHVYGRNKY